MMLTKRDLVKQVAAVVTATAAVVIPARAAQSSYDVVVFNNWHPKARVFAADLSAQGVRTLAVNGDAGRLWYDTLRGLVGGRPCRIAGMTTHTDLLILETLARDQGLRVRRRSNLNGTRLVAWVLT